MDYYKSLPSEPQPMQQQSQATDYAAQLSAVKTLPGLFDFRAKLKAELNSEVCAYLKVFADATTESAQSAQIAEIKFFIDRVESQIKSLESQGIFLAAVDLDLTLEKADWVLEKAEAVAPWGSSPIEEKADGAGLLNVLKKVQSLLKEEEWGCVNDIDCKTLWYNDLVTKADGNINEESVNIYMWRADMDYINFLTNNPPKK